MILKSFRLQCILRVLLMTLTMGLGLSLYILGSYIFSSLVLFILLIIQTFDLINYVERTNRKIAHLVSSIENSDFSQHFFEDRKNNALAELVKAMNQVIMRFGENRRTREEALHFLGTVLEKSPVALFVYEDSGQISWTNSSFHNLLEISEISHISVLAEEFPELHELLLQENSTKKSEVKLQMKARLRYLSVRKNKFGLYGKTLHLVTLQNIHQELDRRESESWEKLMRVLTHEIMNSITPILSLSESASSLVGESDFENKEAIQNSLKTIQSRGDALISFTKRYRQVLQIPQPEPKEFKLGDVLKQAVELFTSKYPQVRFELDLQENINIYADDILLQQVLINLLKNGIEAVPEGRVPQLILSAYAYKNRTAIDIIDNGSGIQPENLDQVFVPFFSMKKEGNGIGLSLSRDIMRAMGGTIRIIKSNPKGSIFQILL